MPTYWHQNRGGGGGGSEGVEEGGGGGGAGYQGIYTKWLPLTKLTTVGGLASL